MDDEEFIRIMDRYLQDEYEKIKVGDYIIDIEKIGVFINVESLGNDEDLIWESLDGKTSICDSIFQFVK